MWRVVILFLALIVPAQAGTRVWLMYGVGGQWTSSGIDTIAVRARGR